MDYGHNKIRHPFDTLYIFLIENGFKERNNTKKVMIFCKRNFLTDFIRDRLSDYGLPTVSYHRCVIISIIFYPTKLKTIE